MEWRMKMEDILKLISVDYWSEVGEILTQIPIDDDYHQKLKKQMVKDKDNLVPILVEEKTYLSEYRDRKFLGNGHHRVRIAYEDGWGDMLVTDDDYASGYDTDLRDRIIER